ncbi:MAG: LacI family DNA-binding transcriptional regulator [Gammaproteobacteria bacterium TMED134]|nr:MAG: LacI family DNA-binding transcriptional regulator [Gammaproteobacteria bacterium TMED134]|tara:strand:- start:991 stop:2031 length:1041 start_codon:yes stop_codon:yes gene_type:complete
MTTIKDVAKVAGVSFKTVSRVINGERGVSERLENKVNAAISDLNYQPNLSARQLRGTASSIAFIYDNPNSHYIIELQQGILSECRKQGYALVINPCDHLSSSITAELTELTRHASVGGLILTPPMSESKVVLETLVKTKIPFVRIVSGSGAPDRHSPCVFVDDRKAAFEITQHLIDQGHRRIALLSGDSDHRSTSERLAGYSAALADRKLRREARLILDGTYSFDSGVSRTSNLLKRAQPPTAVFACNDEIAAGALFAARMHGLSVPRDLSIAGFEDSPFSRQTWPNLTTAHQSNEAIASQATQLLSDEITRRRNDTDAKKSAPPAIGVVPALVIRESTGPAKSGS